MAPEEKINNPFFEGEKIPDVEGRPDLLEYLESLPEVEDTMPPIPEKEPEPEPEFTPEEELANVIRRASGRSRLVKKSQILQEITRGEELLGLMLASESCQDIRSKSGKAEIYFYSSQHMTDNYAMIATLVEEADGPATIAQMVRFHAEKYPAATPFTYFFGTPYNWTREQFMLALEQLRKIPDYEDIVEVHAYDDTPFLISTKFVTEKYGKALADFGQESTESM